VQTGEPFAGASAWDGYRALQITDACVRSLHSGQPVVVAANAAEETHGAPVWSTPG
jgi:hypothetical protein